MKRLVLILVLFFSASVGANAQCPYWEHGEIVDPNSQVNGSSAPNAFCWEPEFISGILFYNGHFYTDYSELLQNQTNTTYNWLSDFRPNKARYVNGDNYYGVLVGIKIHGIFSSNPTLKIGNNHGAIIQEENIYSPSEQIKNGVKYLFFVPIRNANVSSTLAQLDVYDMLEVHHSGPRVNSGTSSKKIEVFIK